MKTIKIIISTIIIIIGTPFYIYALTKAIPATIDLFQSPNIGYMPLFFFIAIPQIVFTLSPILILIVLSLKIRSHLLKKKYGSV